MSMQLDDSRPLDSQLWAMAHAKPQVTEMELALQAATKDGNPASLRAAIDRARAARVPESSPMLRKASALLELVAPAAARSEAASSEQAEAVKPAAKPADPMAAIFSSEFVLPDEI